MAFSRPITDYWNARFSTGDVLHHDAAFEVRVDPGLFGNRQIVVIGHAGRTHAALTPQMAARAGLGRGVLTVESFRRQLVAAGLALHTTDYLFYFPDAAQHALRQASSKPGVRPLDERDVAAFAAFSATSQLRISTVHSSSSTTGRCTARSKAIACCARRVCTHGAAPRSPTPAC